jgi:hypothetical protein
MKVWSKGLGKTELVLDFDGYTVEWNDKDAQQQIHIKGVIRDPVVWDFRITVTKEDLPGLLRLALSRQFFAMVARSPGLLLEVLGRGRRSSTEKALP